MKITPIQVQSFGVKKLLLQLKPHKASGPDRLPNRILKEPALELAQSLTALYNQSLSTQVLPEDWKRAFISPVYKKGDVHTQGNYRPVSLTVVACTILEHIVCRHILNFLDENNVLTHAQHGFRKGHSCETQLLITLSDLFKSLDKRTQVDVGILDFSRAFDTGPHERLLGKLASCGVTGPVNSWIRAFFLLAGKCPLLWMGRSRTRRRSSLGYLSERCWVRCSSSSTSTTWLAKCPLVPLYACLQTTVWFIVKLTLPKTRLSYNKISYVYRHGLNFGVCDSTHPNVISCILAGVNNLLNYMSFVLSSYKVFLVPST